MAGIKRIETRCWTTEYRGPLAITSSQKAPLAEEITWARSLGLEGRMPLGVLLGTVELHHIEAALSIWPRIAGTKEAAMGDYRPDTFGWWLRNPQPIDPVPIKGRLRLWRLPPEFEQSLIPAGATSSM